MKYSETILAFISGHKWLTDKTISRIFPTGRFNSLKAGYGHLS